MSAAVRAGLCLLAGLACGYLAAAGFNRMPAAWLCDYGEPPGPELSGKRLSVKKQGTAWGLGFAAVYFLFSLEYSPASPPFYLLCAAAFFMVPAAAADRRYQILPDQPVAALAAVAALNVLWDFTIGRTGYYGFWLSPFLGAAAGGLVWILLGELGKLLYGKDGAGFGDVKYFAAMGLLCGFPRILYVFCLSVLIAGSTILYRLAKHKIKQDDYIPMGPYLCAACLAALAFRHRLDALAGWYASLLF